MILKRFARLVLLLLPALGACADPAEPRQRYATAQALAGRWSWLSSVHVRTGVLHTPVTDGFMAVLRFEATAARTGTFLYTRSDGLEIAGSFGIASEDEPGNDFIVVDRAIDFLNRNAWIAVLNRDTLRLGGVMEAGYTTSYARVN